MDTDAANILRYRVGLFKSLNSSELYILLTTNSEEANMMETSYFAEEYGFKLLKWLTPWEEVNTSTYINH